MISTQLPMLKPSVIDKTERVLRARLDPSGSQITDHKRVGHDPGDVSAALGALSCDCDMLIVFGASAISDENDVIPQGLRQAGGMVHRLGMPVDPGNLLMLGELDGKPVIGAPGCARSPARNGFDFVLERLLADIGVEADEVAGMGVGGLLMEIASRPQPRDVQPEDDRLPRLHAIVLAAGQSRRMGSENKLLLAYKDKPMVRHVIDAARRAESVAGITVVTGYQPQAVEAAAGSEVEFAHNPDHEQGLSGSLKAGIEALPGSVTHTIILLGDMPQINAAMIDRMAETLSDPQTRDHRIVMATSNGKRGNPVIWPRAHFEALTAITGDTGARHLIGQNRDQVVEVEIGPAGALDVDTPQAYRDIVEGQAGDPS